MSKKIIPISDSFWNLRGDFKIGGVVNIGTHASLVRCGDGKFVMLDSYTLGDDVKQQVDKLTNNGQDLKAIINLHPFHTMHVEGAHEQYPGAELYGTQRHLERFPKLPWRLELCESAEFAELFADDLAFSVPAGVDFISDNSQIHFSSVMAYHPASKTIHVDDTLMYLQPPGLIAWFWTPQIKLHPTLTSALQKRSGAADEFMQWATQMVRSWSDAENLCAAHSSIFLGNDNDGESLANRILNAVEEVASKLQKHKKKYG